MLRKELQSYLDKVFPNSKIESEDSIIGQLHLRFELGYLLENGSIERVNQATERAHIIFNETFENPNSEIWVLIYEYSEPNCFKTSNEYLHQQFPRDQYAKFYSGVEKEEVKIIIGRLMVKDIKVKNILNGIANTEMGFDPGIDQRIYFLDPLTNKGFQMYDDRGCFVWSDRADKIRSIYMNRNNWIVDHHRKEIDEYFK